MESEVVNTGYSKIWMDKNGIIRTKYTLKTDITLESAKEETEIIYRLSSGRKVPVMVNMGNTKSISREAREHYSSDENVNVMAATALIVNSPVHKIMGNFFLGINKPPYPIKLFSSENEAIKWLRQFAEQEEK